jgi:hypothetical protein
MTLTSFQLSYNGLTFGAGTDVQLVQITGLRELPSIRSGDVAKPRTDGAWAGLNFYNERILVMDLLVSVTKTNPFETVLQSIANAFLHISDPGALLPFQFMLPGWTTPRQVTGRPTKGGFPVDLDYSFHRAAIPVEFTCPDPLIYDTVVQTASTGLPSPATGLTFNVHFPATFGHSVGGSFQVTNAGNYPTPPVFTITGPCTNPSISLQGTGLSITFTIALANTDTLVVDMGALTATLNGTALRNNTINTGSTWFALPAGTSTVQFLSSDSTSVAGQLAIAFRNAWGWA